MVICTIIRILDGMKLRTHEMKKLEKAVTKVKAILITTAVFMLVVTANAEQIPSICKAIGLLPKIGSTNTSLVDSATNMPLLL